MKRIISLLVVMAMMLASVLAVIPVSATGSIDTSDSAAMNSGSSTEPEDKVEITLKKFTAENPSISIQVDKCCTEYGDAQYSRCNYSNGASEQMWGFVDFEEPQEVFY